MDPAGTSIGNAASSRLVSIYERYNERMKRIDDLERRINERVRRCRRRITNIVDSAPTFRQSHARVFITHSSTSVEDSANLALDGEINGELLLKIEGRLLAGAIDYDAAQAADAKSGYVTPNDDLDKNRSDKEEEDVTRADFTHLFDRVKVRFETIYAPASQALPPLQISPTSQPPTKKNKTSRRSSGGTNKAEEATEIDPRLLSSSGVSSSVYDWNRSMSDDSYAFEIAYKPTPPQPHLQVVASVAHIELYTRLADEACEPLYQVSAEIGRALFPHYKRSVEPLADPPQQQSPAATNKSNKRVAAEASLLDPNSVDMPTGLTLGDIVNGFYTYICDKSLQDESDRGTILCDDVLRRIFEVDSFSFFNLEQMVQKEQHITNIKAQPVKARYVLKYNEATNVAEIPQLLQFDMCVQVPNHFPFRCREVLRRVKRRELEYTNARTKARYQLLNRKAKDEDEIRTQIDCAALGFVQVPKVKDVDSSNDGSICETLAAIAKSALPNTEARLSAQLDAQISFLVSQLPEADDAAIKAWEKVEALKAKL